MSKGADFTKVGLKIRKGFYIFIKILFSRNSAAYNVLWLKFLQIVFIPVDFLFFLVEKIGLKTEDDKGIPILFVVGIQRTGSTLISQFIEKTFDFFPIGNLNSVFKQSKFYLHKWFSKLHKKPSISYKNYYGISKGFFSIGDCYELWDRWFGKNHYVLPNNFNDERLHNLIHYFSFLYKAYKKPLLTKNNRNSLLLPIFNKAFHNAFYVIVKRDPVAVIRSTIKASKDFFGKGDLLWGLYPNNDFDTKNYENIVEAATVQFLLLDKLLNEQIKKLADNSFLIVDYDEFCSNPQKFQKELTKKLENKKGYSIENIQFMENPFKTSQRLNNLQIDDQIKDYIDKWESKI
ncbi:sulfotransferase [Bacteroidota bacterium]